MRMHQTLMPCVVAMTLFCGTARDCLVNPGFETDNASAADVPGATGWGGFNANFTTRAFAHTGTQSLKVFGPFFQFGGAGAVQAQPAVAGTSYTASAFVFSPSADQVNGTNFAVVKVEFLDVSNAVIGAFEECAVQRVHSRRRGRLRSAASRSTASSTVAGAW